MQGRGFGECLVDFLAFHVSKIVNVGVMQGPGHTIFHALRISTAQVALGRYMLQIFKMHASKWTGKHTHSAADTKLFIHDYGPCVRIAPDGIGRANIQAGRHVALKAGQGKNGALIHVDLNPDICIFAFETAGFLK